MSTVSMLVLFMFAAVLWSGIIRYLNIDCGCFSSDEIMEQRSLYKALYRDSVFMAVSIFIFICRLINEENRPVSVFLQLLLFQVEVNFHLKNSIMKKIAVKYGKDVLRGGYKIADTGELKKWSDSKRDMLIVDTMPLADSYNKNHIPDAILILFDIPELGKTDHAKKAELIKLLGGNRDRTVVFYCGFTKCTRSHNGAMWAVRLGYKNVYRYPAGITGWKEAGFPVEKAESK